jgi:hypothetical protein
MGGRSRNFHTPDRWDWVKEVSDSRLERYGKMSGYSVDRSGSNDRGKFALHLECSAEYNRRHGQDPTWYRKGKG